MSKNLSELSGRKGLKDNLFDRIGVISNDTPSLKDFEDLAKEYKIGTANVYGSTTFYDFTRPSNRDKKIYICNGSACMTAGTQANLKNNILNHFNDHEIGEMCCLGRCYENSAFHLNGVNFSGSDQNISEIISGVSKHQSFCQVYSSGKPILTGNDLSDVSTFKSLLNKLLDNSPEDLLEEIKLANVRGRGGAGFPMHIKLNGCKQANSEDGRKFIVCNADEGDPGAFSDRYLMELQPYKVLFGMVMAGYITGADWGVLYIRAEYPESIHMIQESIAQLMAAGLLGENIMDSGFSFYFKVIKAQGAYICGEETALISSIEGQRPEVRVRPPFPVVEGLFNRPTVVQNVETLACLPFILSHGGGAFSQIGTEKSKGTKLVSLDSHFQKPGLYEVEMGHSLSHLLNEMAGGFSKPVKALHIGGPLGGLVPFDKISELTVDFESFSKAGFLLGHASVVCIPRDFPLITYLRHLFEFTAHESCGKCFPCRLGSTRGAELLKKAENDGYKIDAQLFQDLLFTLEKGSLCALGGGLPLPVKNALQYFQEELRMYFQE